MVFNTYKPKFSLFNWWLLKKTSSERTARNLPSLSSWSYLLQLYHSCCFVHIILIFRNYNKILFSWLQVLPIRIFWFHDQVDESCHFIYCNVYVTWINVGFSLSHKIFSSISLALQVVLYFFFFWRNEVYDSFWCSLYIKEICKYMYIFQAL